MDSEVETIQKRFTSLFGQLQAEHGVLGRMIYKNKNQHRRCFYFKHLLKVGRDLKLLQSVHLEELVISCLLVIKGDKPKQKAHLLECLKRRKCNSGKYNFLERILGAARLLAVVQLHVDSKDLLLPSSLLSYSASTLMVEPMLKAATEVFRLFAQSFFMGFSLTVMAILARLRVLVQQILLDIVTLFNMVSSISQKKQSIKIKQEGVEVFREYFPVCEDFVMLECVWKSDKFVLLEKKCKSENASKNDDAAGSSSVPASAINYNSIDSCLGETENDQPVSERNNADSGLNDEPSHVKGVTSDLLNQKEMTSCDVGKRKRERSCDDDDEEGRENPRTITEEGLLSFNELLPKDSLQLHASMNSTTKPDSSSSFNELLPKDSLQLHASMNSTTKPDSSSSSSSSSKKVAFVSVKRPKSSTQQDTSPLAAATVCENSESKNDKEGDTLANVLSDGIPRNNSVF